MAFVRALRPRKLTPTVYESAADRDKIAGRFSALLDGTAAKRAFFAAFAAPPARAGAAKHSRGAGAGAGAAVEDPPGPAIEISDDDDDG